MKEYRTFCADSPYGKNNCEHAKVVEEEGKFHVIYETTTLDSNGRVLDCSKKKRTETSRCAVYCIYQKEENKLVGTVEPYGGICRTPKDCPLLHEDSKTTIWNRIKSFFGL